MNEHIELFSSRKNFKFYKSYADIYFKLKKMKQKTRFIDAILKINYGLIQIKDVDFSDDFVLDLAWGSVEHSIATQIQGVINKSASEGASDVASLANQQGASPQYTIHNNTIHNTTIKEGGKGNAPPPLFFRVYMDVLDYLKDNGKNNKSLEIEFEGIIVKVSTYGIAYNKATSKDLERPQETRFLTYLMNNTKLLTA